MLNRLRERVARAIEPVQQRGHAGEIANGTFFPTQSGGTFSRGTLGAHRTERAYGDMPWLRSAVHKIAEAMGATVWTVEKVVDDNGSALSSRVMRRGNFQQRKTKRKSLQRQGLIHDVPDEHPLVTILDEGNPLMSGSDVMQLSDSLYELTGNSVNVITKNLFGRPGALWPIPTSWVHSFPNPSELVFRFHGNRIGSRVLPADQVLWVKDPDPARPYGSGLGTAMTLGDELDTDEYAAQFVKAFFANGAMPEALVGVEADADSVKAQAASWYRRNRGVDKSHRVHFVGGKLDVNMLGHRFKDQEVIALRKFVRDTVQQVYGIPPEMLGIIENSNRATIEAASFMFATWVLIPRLEKFRKVFQGQLAPMFDDRLIVDYVSPVPEDTQLKVELIKATPWNFERGEIRETAGFEAREDDAVYVMPLNLIEVPAPSDEVQELSAPTTQHRQLPAAKAVDTTDVDNIALAAAAAELSDRVASFWSEELKDWGDQVMDDLNVGVSFGLINPETTAHLAEFSSSIEGANATTQAALRSTLSQGVAAGESIDSLAVRVHDVFDAADKNQARAIARTEVLRSSNFGSLESFRQSGAVAQKKWIATPLPEIRHAGTEIDGQVRALGSAFTLDGFTAQHPGDFGVAEHDVNCRCTIIAVVNNASMSRQTDDQIWRRDQRRRAPWERRAVKVLRQGFEVQRRDVIAALLRASR